MIRLMSHNVWNNDQNQPAWAEKGQDCSAEARVHGLVHIYKDTLPDIIGCQEVSPFMLDLLREKMLEAGLEYAIIWGRFTPILYRADKFELVDTAFGTYPEKIAGYDGNFNDMQSKAWNLGVFREKKTGKSFVFVTTHLWWMSSDKKDGVWYQKYSDEAREIQIAIAVDKTREYCKKYSCPAVLVGDLNTGYESKAVQYLLENNFRHAHDVATDYAEEAVGYHECAGWGFASEYNNNPFVEAIDHIFVSEELGNTVKRFERYSPEYYLPISDHSPAYIDVEFKEDIL